MTREAFHRTTYCFNPQDFGCIGLAAMTKLGASSKKERKYGFAAILAMLKSSSLIPRAAIIETVARGCDLNGGEVLLVEVAIPQYSEETPNV